MYSEGKQVLKRKDKNFKPPSKYDYQGTSKSQSSWAYFRLQREHENYRQLCTYFVVPAQIYYDN